MPVLRDRQAFANRRRRGLAIASCEPDNMLRDLPWGRGAVYHFGAKFSLFLLAYAAVDALN